MNGSWRTERKITKRKHGKKGGKIMLAMRFHMIVLAAALALVGCGGGGGGPPPPNVLPDEALPDGLGGIEDHFAEGGRWQVNLDGQVQSTAFGGVSLANALVYDADRDEWTVTIDGGNFVLTNELGIGVYESAGCAGTTNCAVFAAYADPVAVDMYGTFGIVGYADATTITFVFAHAGLKTPLGDMPVDGTASFDGVFEGAVFYTDANFPGVVFFDAAVGTANVDANFGTGGGVTFASSGTGDFPGSTYALSGSATISGNTYDGQVTGFYDDADSANIPSLQLDESGSGSTLSGAFYGPDANQTAGIVYATSAPGDSNPGEITGGFWATQ